MIEKYVIDIRFIILEFFWLNIQARWNEKIYGGGGGGGTGRAGSLSSKKHVAQVD